jgi:hypothetical protein
MKPIQKFEVHIKNGKLSFNPNPKKGKSLDRVRIILQQESDEPAHFYMGKDPKTNDWIPESLPPEYLTTDMIGEISKELNKIIK